MYPGAFPGYTNNRRGTAPDSERKDNGRAEPAIIG